MKSDQQNIVDKMRGILYGPDLDIMQGGRYYVALVAVIAGCCVDVKFCVFCLHLMPSLHDRFQ